MKWNAIQFSASGLDRDIDFRTIWRSNIELHLAALYRKCYLLLERKRQVAPNGDAILITYIFLGYFCHCVHPNAILMSTILDQYNISFYGYSEWNTRT